MRYAVKNNKGENMILKVERMDYVDYPPENDYTHLVTFCRDYDIGEHYSDSYTCLCELLDKYGVDYTEEDSYDVDTLFKKFCSIDSIVVYNLYLYDHSGLSLSWSDTSFVDREWDVSLIGFAYADIKDFDNDKESAKTCLRGSIQEWDDYLQGEVYEGTLYEVTPYKFTRENLKTGEVTTSTSEQEDYVDSLGYYYASGYENSEKLAKEIAYDLGVEITEELQED